MKHYLASIFSSDITKSSNKGSTSFWGGGNFRVDTATTVEESSGLWGQLGFFDIIGLIVLAVVLFYFLRWAIRLAAEIIMSKDLVYIEVTLPRSDSKLDKERETKKDFKEKIGIMSLVYKSLHKIDSASFRYSIMDFFLRHVKISLEMVFKKGQLYFYVVTY